MSGTLLAALLGLSASLMGNSGFLLVLIYFGLAIITDKIKYNSDNHEQNDQKTRGASQVIANGAIPFFAAILYFLTGDRLFATVFAVGFCESLSDTAASGIGIRSRRTFDLFRLRRCASGESGGVSFLGSIGAIVFAVVFSVIACLLQVITPTESVVVFISALLGVTLDTMLGSLIQPRYKCCICGEVTEHDSCCGEPSQLLRGARIITNSSVNFISALFSSLVCAFFSLF